MKKNSIVILDDDGKLTGLASAAFGNLIISESKLVNDFDDILLIPGADKAVRINGKTTNIPLYWRDISSGNSIGFQPGNLAGGDV